VTVQNAQNPSSLTWQFPTNVLQADPLTAQPFTSVYLNAYQSYMISIQGTNSGQYNLLAQLRELPSNDYFSNALTWSPQTTNGLPTSISSNGYNIYATTEPGNSLSWAGRLSGTRFSPFKEALIRPRSPVTETSDSSTS